MKEGFEVGVEAVAEVGEGIEEEEGEEALEDMISTTSPSKSSMRQGKNESPSR